ncbi:MAG: phosphopantetheine-binding protein [Brevundimonas sp.]|jgi:acyl carrier protein|nr:phosphopantetheine-binding protein [Brevundimonas sp.]
MSKMTRHEGKMRSTTDQQLRRILSDVLGLKPGQADAFEADTGLFGHLPELDSMAVAGLLTEMEDRLEIVIEDDEVDGELLETYGALLAFAEAKREAA